MKRRRETGMWWRVAGKVGGWVVLAVLLVPFGISWVMLWMGWNLPDWRWLGEVNVVTWAIAGIFKISWLAYMPILWLLVTLGIWEWEGSGRIAEVVVGMMYIWLIIKLWSLAGRKLFKENEKQ
jgi:hypothetical protein